ncbi:MAG: sugar phosphate nucleotidyltransferase, partial [Kiritimatiellia bacterium]
MKRYACILAGGRGERFWPMSTLERPKQVLALSSDKPMLAEAVDRVAELVPAEQVLVITNASLVDACRSAIPQVPAENVIGEPCGRDTAAACALAGAIVAKRCPDGVLAMLTADHVMRDGSRFRAVLRGAYEKAVREPVIVTLGIKPDYPATGFGYIECDQGVSENGVVFRAAKRFVEKPDRATAEGYLQTGRYLWNGGMFIWSVRTLQDALERHVPV